MTEPAALLKEIGAESPIHSVDLADETAIQAAYADEIKARYDRVDVLINNAGLAYGEISRGFEDLSQARWLHFLAINTVAPLLLAHALCDLPAVGLRNFINQSSMASHVPGTA